MLTLLLVIVILVLVSGGGFYGRRAQWGPRGFLGLLLLALIIVAVVWAVNDLLEPPLPMIVAPPSLIK